MRYLFLVTSPLIVICGILFSEWLYRLNERLGGWMYKTHVLEWRVCVGGDLGSGLALLGDARW